MIAVDKELQRLLERYPKLGLIKENIVKAYTCLEATVSRDGLILICGNGGSAADSGHIVGELMKGFNSRRPLGVEQVAALTRAFPEEGSAIAHNLQGALRAISLTAHDDLITAFANDCDPSYIYAQQVWGYGRTGDTLICISTSGNSKNVIKAAQVGKAKGLHVVGMTGEHGGRLRELCDVTIGVPSTMTSDIQEYHLPIYHTLCLMLEQRFFGGSTIEQG